MRSRIRSPLHLLVLGALLALPGAVSAQDISGDRVRVALERTDERIELAQSLLTDSPNEPAAREVNAALALQAQAKEVFGQATSASGDLQLRLLRQVVDLTLRARGHADRAIAIVQGLPDPERVLAQVERTAELIERARDRIEECGNDRARSLLRVAMEMQQRAESAVRESRYLGALQLTMSARERVLRALRLCKIEENLREAAERALRRTDDVLGRAREIVTDHPSEQARQLLARAERVQVEAWTQFRAERFEASLRMTQSARSLAMRAVRLAGSSP